MEVMAMIPRRNCLWDDDAIERYSMGTLPEPKAAELEEHLLICESCQQRLAREDAIRGHIRRAAMRHRQTSQEKESGIRLFPRLAMALAAVAVLLVVGAVAMRWSHVDGTRTPPFALKLEAMRGAGPGSKAPAGRSLAVEADLSGLPQANSYRLELVDSKGAAIWKGRAPKANIPALRPGMYFMRVYSDQGQLLREYGIEASAAAR